MPKLPNRRDWVLLAIAAASGEPVSPVQLQKCLFLLSKQLPQEIDGEHFYDFDAYDYGPFAKEVYVDAHELEDLNYVQISERFDPRRTYRATPQGIEEAARLRELCPTATDYLARLMTWARDLSFGDLVRSVYAAYPEMRKNSVFRGQIA